MTIQAQAWIWEHSRAGGASKLVQLALAELGSYGDDPAVAHIRTAPLVDALARQCNMYPRTVIAALDDLERLRETEFDESPVAGVLICTFRAMQAGANHG